MAAEAAAAQDEQQDQPDGAGDAPDAPGVPAAADQPDEPVAEPEQHHGDHVQPENHDGLAGAHQALLQREGPMGFQPYKKPSLFPFLVRIGNTFIYKKEMTKMFFTYMYSECVTKILKNHPIRFDIHLLVKFEWVILSNFVALRKP